MKNDHFLNARGSNPIGRMRNSGSLQGRILDLKPEAVLQPSTSSFSSTSKDYSGKIYGIYKNLEFPKKITTLKATNCVYVGKDTQDDGLRIQQHINNDSWAPWYKGNQPKGTYDQEDTDKWPYVWANIWTFKQITLFDLAVAEQYFIQDMALNKAPLLNDANAISPENFATYKTTSAFSTKSEYPSSFKVVDFKTLMG